MTVTLTEPVTQHRTLHAAADHVRQCGCGQSLDVCHAGHCPRCGVTLRD